LRWAKPTSREPSLRAGSPRNSLRLSVLRLAGRAPGPRATEPGRPPRRVLLLRPDHVGDVLLTAPAVALVRQSLPVAHLTYIVGPWSVAAARQGPRVDSLRALRYPGFTRRPKLNALAPYLLLAREAARLRHEAYDLALLFRPDHWWGALLALAAGIPLRVGGDTPETRPLLTHVHPAGAGQHAAERSLAIARLALQAASVAPIEPAERVAYRVPSRAAAAATDLWQWLSLDGQRVVALQPSAGAPLKSWPAERWATLADALLGKHLAVILIGAPEDGPLLSAILGHMHGHAPLVYGQPLDVSAAVYQRSNLLVGVDSGAAHLAAAVGTPTVRLYGPAPAAAFGPWPPRQNQRVLVTSKLVCVPCGNLESPPCGARTTPACMLALGVQEVMNSIDELLHS
jgi:ADP-heptose:LPS heptosyltransferase